MPGISIAILAGGQSRRLGVNKAFVEIDGRTLIERVLETVGSLSCDLLVVTNEPAPFAHLPVRVVGDIYPGKASLGGIYSGLYAARESHALVLACDMPFLSRPLLEYMMALSPSYEIVVPHYDGFYEPLHAIYATTCLLRMAQLIAADRLRIAELLAGAETRYVTADEIDRFDPAHLSFFNVNTPEDLVRARVLDRFLRAGEPLPRELWAGGDAP